MNLRSNDQEAALFRVKICGVTRLDDVLSVIRSGADGIGFNFYEHSARYVSPTKAADLAASCPPGLARVGVFVNANREAILDCVNCCQLDWVQFHGDESPEYVSSFADDGFRIIRAFRWGAAGLAPIVQYIGNMSVAARDKLAVLLDAAQPGQYGGTGQTLDWHGLATEVGQLGEIPWILAGGLTPANVGEAIDCLHPTAVDTASGVESTPGIKDSLAIQEFTTNALNAFSRK